MDHETTHRMSSIFKRQVRFATLPPHKRLRLLRHHGDIATSNAEQRVYLAHARARELDHIYSKLELSAPAGDLLRVQMMLVDVDIAMREHRVMQLWLEEEEEIAEAEEIPPGPERDWVEIMMEYGALQRSAVELGPQPVARKGMSKGYERRLREERRKLDNLRMEVRAYKPETRMPRGYARYDLPATTPTSTANRMPKYYEGCLLSKWPLPIARGIPVPVPNSGSGGGQVMRSRLLNFDIEDENEEVGYDEGEMKLCEQVRKYRMQMSFWRTHIPIVCPVSL